MRRATLVADINPEPDTRHHFTRPVRVRGKVFFNAYRNSTGQELWVSDGTTGRARLVRDIFPGQTSSNPQELTPIGPRLYFVAGTPDAGRQIWTTRGTRRSTRAVTEFEAGSTEISGLFEFAGKLYFQADTPDFGTELWVTGGGLGKALRVTDIAEGPTHSFPTFIGPWRTGFLIAARDAERRTAPYFVDPENDSVEPIAADWPVGDIGRDLLALPGGSFFLFRAYEEETGYEPWVSDGTPEGTNALGEIRPGRSPGGPYNPIWAAGMAFFSAIDALHGSELWVTDGSPAGTRLVRDIRTGPGSSIVHGTQAAALHDGIVFAADDGVHGLELWKSDGTDDGTFLLVDFEPGRERSAPALLWSDYSVAYYTVENRSTGRHLLRTDGTPEGTFELTDTTILWTEQPQLSEKLFRDDFVFALDPHSGSLPMRSDGTALNTGAIPLPPSATRTGATVLGASLEDRFVFFATSSEYGTEPWTTDGTEAGTMLLEDIALEGSSNSNTPRFVPFGGRLYFSAQRSRFPKPGLWRTDGTPGGTELFFEGMARALRVLNGFLYFTSGSSYDERLWRTDGTWEGTIELTEPGRFQSISAVDAFSGSTDQMGGILIQASDREHGSELWRMNANGSGLALVKDILPGRDGGFSSGVFLDSNRYLFSGRDHPSNTELWTTDGTSDGTHVLREIVEGSDGGGGGAPSSLTAVGGRVFFAARTHDHGRELWLTDGTSDGTRMVREIVPGAANGIEPGSYTRSATFVALGETLIFRTDDGEHGVEVWRSDGTPTGTYMLRDIYPGQRSSRPSDMTVVDDVVLFTANDGRHGEEVWITDGTRAGTHLFIDQVPGSGGSAPHRFWAAGDRVMLGAEDDRVSFELFSFPRRWLCKGSRRARPPSRRSKHAREEKIFSIGAWNGCPRASAPAPGRRNWSEGDAGKEPGGQYPLPDIWIANDSRKPSPLIRTTR